MKRILLLLLLIPSSLYAQKLEKYCEIMAIGKLFSNKVSITVDFGEQRGFFKDARLKDEEGNVVNFNTLIDALNYMGTKGWKLVNAFPVTTGNSNVYHFYFKKEYDISELAPEQNTDPKK